MGTKIQRKYSDANLVEYKYQPGQSGNPKGKPRGAVSIISAVKRRLRELSPDDPDGKRRIVDDLAESLIHQFMAGNPAAIKQIMDRIDGLVIAPQAEDTSKQALNKIDQLIGRLDEEANGNP